MIENLRLSFQSIWSHKLRSILTMLGVIIGIAAIIAIVSIIQGVTDDMKKNAFGGSNNTINLEFGPEMQFQMEYKGEMSSTPPPYMNDISKDTINKARTVPGLKNIAVYYIGYGDVFSKEKYSSSQIYAVDGDYFLINEVKLLKGRAFNKFDYQHMGQTIILNESAYSTLFPMDDGLGKLVEMFGQPYLVIGVLKETSAEYNMMAMYGKDMGTGYVTKNNWRSITGTLDATPTITIQTEKTDDLKKVADEAAAILNNDIPQPTDFVFGTYDMGNFEAEIEEFQRGVLLLLGGIASISLLVGGIGVMNIMLVSVTERTREIGIKKALGAKRSTILFQFLTEAVVLTLLGGVLGVLGGIGATKIIANIMDRQAVFSIEAILAGLGFSIFVGIVFGLLPAVKASKLNPIEALRYE